MRLTANVVMLVAACILGYWAVCRLPLRYSFVIGLALIGIVTLISWLMAIGYERVKEELGELAIGFLSIPILAPAIMAGAECLEDIPGIQVIAATVLFFILVFATHKPSVLGWERDDEEDKEREEELSRKWQKAQVQESKPEEPLLADLPEPKQKKKKLVEKEEDNMIQRTDEDLDLLQEKRTFLKNLIENVSRLNEGESVFSIEAGSKATSTYALNYFEGYTRERNSKLSQRMRSVIIREHILVILETVKEIRELCPEWKITDPKVLKIIAENKQEIPKEKQRLDGILGILESYS